MRENHYGMLPVQLISGYASAGHYWRASSASGQGSQRTGRGDSEGIDLCLNEGDEVVDCDLIIFNIKLKKIVLRVYK